MKNRIARGDFTEPRVIGRYGLNVMASQNQRGDTSHLRALPPVSVILTVMNEETHLHGAVSAALHSRYAGEIEVVIAVGPSHDRTLEIAEQLAKDDARVTVIPNPSGKTPNGLNAALKASRFEIVVRIDGHSEIESEYIDQAVATLDETNAVNVGGIMAADGITPFQRAVARAMRSPIGVGAARFHTGGRAGPTDTVYLGVFRRSALTHVGGYDERFVRAQDWELNHRLRQSGGTIWFNPELKVTYRPRNSIRALARQYFEYGRWRRAVSRHHKGTINFRYLAPPINLIINFFSIFLGILYSPVFFFAGGLYVTAICMASLWIGKSFGERLRLPFVLITMHFCWGFGFILSPNTLLPR